MPGPDFPTGGTILGNQGYIISFFILSFSLTSVLTLVLCIQPLPLLVNSILEAYKSGRGRIVVRGKTDIETIDEKSKRTAIIIKEV